MFGRSERRGRLGRHDRTPKAPCRLVTRPLRAVPKTGSPPGVVPGHRQQPPGGCGPWLLVGAVAVRWYRDGTGHAAAPCPAPSWVSLGCAAVRHGLTLAVRNRVSRGTVMGPLEHGRMDERSGGRPDAGATAGSTVGRLGRSGEDPEWEPVQPGVGQHLPRPGRGRWSAGAGTDRRSAHDAGWPARLPGSGSFHVERWRLRGLSPGACSIRVRSGRASAAATRRSAMRPARPRGRRVRRRMRRVVALAGGPCSGGGRLHRPLPAPPPVGSVVPRETGPGSARAALGTGSWGRGSLTLGVATATMGR